MSRQTRTNEFVRATRVIVVADSGKFGRSGMGKVLCPEDYELIISDSGLGKEVLKRLTGKGIQVKIAIEG